MMLEFIKSPTTGNEYALPRTAEDWALYTDMNGVKQAAGGLFTALKSQVLFVERQALTGMGPDAALKKGMARMRKKMRKYEEYGALDTEPRNIAYGCLRRAFAANIEGG